MEGPYPSRRRFKAKNALSGRFAVPGGLGGLGEIALSCSYVLVGLPKSKDMRKEVKANTAKQLKVLGIFWLF